MNLQKNESTFEGRFEEEDVQPESRCLSFRKCSCFERGCHVVIVLIDGPAKLTSSFEIIDRW